MIRVHPHEQPRQVCDKLHKLVEMRAWMQKCPAKNSGMTACTGASHVAIVRMLWRSFEACIKQVIRER